MKAFIKISVGLLILSVFLAPLAIRGAMDIFLKLTDIAGESLDEKHKDEIEVVGWSWGLTQPGTLHTGTGTGDGKVSVQDLSITKYMDKATPKLLLRVSDGGHIEEAVLTIRQSGDTPVEFYRITMNDVLVTSVQQGGSTIEDRFLEDIKLNFAKVKVEYMYMDPDTKTGGTIPYSWDIQANKEQ